METFLGSKETKGKFFEIKKSQDILFLPLAVVDESLWFVLKVPQDCLDESKQTHLLN